MKNRRVEWMASLSLLGWGLTLALPGDTIGERSAYRSFFRAGWEETEVGVTLAVVGVIWCMALLANGHWKRSPVFRGGASLMGAMIWCQLTWLLIKDSVDVGAASPGVPIYGLLAYFSFVACYASARDAVRARQESSGRNEH